MLRKRSRPEVFEDPQLCDDFDEVEFSVPDLDTSELAELDNFVANSSYGELRWTTPESKDESSSDGEDLDGDVSVQFKCTEPAENFFTTKYVIPHPAPVPLSRFLK